MSESLRVIARGKINLFLRVGAKRPDGYHDLETLFHAIELADTVTIARVPGSTLTLECALDVPPEKNLAMRAARLFLSKCGEERLGLRLTLEKKIPVEAGLGGGSADAAAVLVGLNALLDAPFDVDELCRLGRTLGADVPFCITGGMAEGRGIGDKLKRLPAAKFALVIVKPPVSVSTPWAYGALDDAPGEPIPGSLDEVVARLMSDGATALGGLTGNDFERVVLPAKPEIARARDALGAAGAAWAMMSGSGAAVFGVFESADAAARASAELTADGLAAEAAASASRGAEVVN